MSLDLDAARLMILTVQWVPKVLTPASIRYTLKQGSWLLWPTAHMFYVAVPIFQAEFSTSWTAATHPWATAYGCSRWTRTLKWSAATWASITRIFPRRTTWPLHRTARRSTSWNWIHTGCGNSSIKVRAFSIHLVYRKLGF